MYRLSELTEGRTGLINYRLLGDVKINEIRYRQNPPCFCIFIKHDISSQACIIARFSDNCFSHISIENHANLYDIGADLVRTKGKKAQHDTRVKGTGCRRWRSISVPIPFWFLALPAAAATKFRD